MFNGFNIVSSDLNRPWGGFYCIDPKDLDEFIATYFPTVSIDTHLPLSPKILLIDSHKKLSFQYHYKRREYWYVIEGPVGVVKSLSDVPTPMQIYNTHDVIIIDKEERHRLVGLRSLRLGSLRLNNHAIVAEIWEHIDAHDLSDESDIVRLEDDYQRC
jgi:mannose-6-phosphate isomerase-like protein (cupin superfamily)